MGKYVYSAIFHPEEDGMISIYFPDIEGCVSCGDSMYDGIKMAEDALALMLASMEVDKRTIPEPSDPQKIETESGDYVVPIACDTSEYIKKFSKKSIKKTLTIPEWLNEKAVSMNINFSKVLQEALLERIKE